MTSSIDTSLPIQGRPTTASVRSNFAYAKSEIEALQRTTGGWINVLDYGTDGTAIVAAYAAAANGTAIYCPAGTYEFSTAPTFGNKQLAIIGDGSRQTIWKYTGTNTTNDCFTFGTLGSQVGGIRMSGIQFTSDTVMTGGNGVRFNKLLRSVLTDVMFSHQDGNTNFYHGVWFDGFDYVTLDNFQIKAQQDGLRISGNGTTGADLYITNAKIGGCTVGVRVGGSAGGVHFDFCGIINNATNVIIDNTLSGATNREITFGPHCAIDSACSALDAATFDGVNVDIQDGSGFVTFKDTWNASCGTCLRVGASVTGTVRLNGGFLYNAFTAFGGNGRGIECNSTNATIIATGTRFKNCDAIAVYASVSTPKITLTSVTYDTDVVARIDANVTRTGEALDEYADDAAAAAGGLPLGAYYRTASAVKQRVA